MVNGIFIQIPGVDVLISRSSRGDVESHAGPYTIAGHGIVCQYESSSDNVSMVSPCCTIVKTAFIFLPFQTGSKAMHTGDIPII
jgi:hypothetical protein